MMTANLHDIKSAHVWQHPGARDVASLRFEDEEGNNITMFVANSVANAIKAAFDDATAAELEASE